MFKDTSGSYSVDYLYAAGLRIASVDSSTGSYSTVKYFHVDHLGSTRLVSSATKAVLFTDGYQPFGPDNGIPTGSETHKFTGKPWSSDSSFYYYYYQRWYDPSIGRFISPDPQPGRLSNPQTLNLYVYVVNSPTIYNDPSGEFLNIVIGAVAGAVIGGAVCAWQNGGWSDSCLTSIAVGAIAGAVAGATFNPALGMFAGTSLAGTLTATVAAGAISGALSGGASYVATGAIASAAGQQFNWSAKDLALSIGVGALAGGALAGTGYGVGRALSKIGNSLAKGGPSEFRIVDFAPKNPNTGYPGGIAKALGHRPVDVGDEAWLSGIQDVVNRPLWTTANPGGGIRSYGTIDNYMVRVVIGRAGAIINAFPVFKF